MRQRSSSILQYVFQRQVYGELENKEVLYETVPNLITSSIHPKYKSLQILCSDIRQAFDTRSQFDMTECMSVLKNLERALGEKNEDCHKNIEIVCVFDTPRVLINVLQRQFGPTTNQDARYLKCLLSSLREACFLNSNISKRICDDDSLICYLFELLGSSALFESAVGLLEELIVCRLTPFDLTKIPDFHLLFNAFSGRHTAIICRILALVVFEPEDRTLMTSPVILKSYDLLQMRRKRIMKTNTIVERNHALVLDSENRMLERLILILRIQIAAPRFQDIMSGFSTAAELVAVLEDAESSWSWEESLLLTDEELKSNPRIQIQAISLAPHQVELLFVLCTLLNGKRRTCVQYQLAELGIVDIMFQMLKNIEWGTDVTTHHETTHGPGCECSQDTALRIQVLRLIHNFYDRENYRYGVRDPSTFDMLNHIVHIVMHEPEDSSYRFWLISCLEVYLRGASAGEQRFIFQTPLVDFLLEQVLQEKIESNGSLQTTFDLFGELVKGNVQLLFEFGDKLPNEQLRQLFRIMEDHLVDSNVFFRSIFLTLEQDSTFSSLFHPMPTDQPVRLIMQDTLADNIQALMKGVSIQSVDHENVCCINTAILVFLYANRQNYLAQFLEQMRESEDSIKEFRLLLRFWREYYRLRGRDQLSLELSSKVPYREWEQLVDLLCADDATSTSLL